MANEKILNTRIQLKYDSYEKWNSSSVVLKAGEIAIAYLAPANKDGSTHASNQHPVLFKVGDGTHTFANLPWASALAADVYAWAKQENLPVIDNGEGKFVTDITWDSAQNSLVVSRSDIDWSDIKNVPDFGVLTIEAADASLEITPDTGDIKAKAKLSAAEGNILRLENDGLYVPAPSVVDTGVMSITGKEAIKTIGDTETEIRLALNNSGNVTLSQDDNGLKAEISLTDLGLSNVMHFIGAFAEAPANPKAGDVYLNTTNHKEYVYDDTNGWVELGDEGSYALKTITITGTDGLVGGGSLEANREIKLSEATKASLLKADNAKQKQNTYTANGSTAQTVTKVEQNENGEVTVTYGDIAFPVPPVVNDGKFTVSGTGALTGTGFMTANQADDTTATLDVADKGITTAKIADHAVGAHQTKACQDYSGEDAEVWVFYCGTSEVLV